MPNYQQGKIYKIVSNTDDELCYVGSTTLPLLCQRIAEHRTRYGIWKRSGKGYKNSSYEMFEKYGIENCVIELIEIFPCNTKDELTKKEAYYIRLLNCVNKVIPDRTIKEYNKAYWKANKDRKVEYNKAYWKANKEVTAEKGKVKYTCACGSTIRKGEKTRHERSLKHINYCASVSVVP